MRRSRPYRGGPAAGAAGFAVAVFVWTLLLGAVMRPPAAAATDYRWNNPAGGTWGQAANWLPAGVPATAADSAYVPMEDAAFNIDLDLSPALRGCLLENPQAVVRLRGRMLASYGAFVNHGELLAEAGFPSSLWGDLTVAPSGSVRVQGGTTLTMYGTNWRNDGVIRVHEGGPESAYLRPATHLTLLGGGSLVLQDSTRAVVENPWGYWLTNAAGHTIRGAGTLAAPLVNHGLVEADRDGEWLLLATASKSNDGVLRAAGGGWLRIHGISLTNTDGIIEALGGPVQIDGATVAGGTFGSDGGRAVTTLGAVTLVDVGNTGRLEIGAGSTTTISGSSLLNEGVVALPGPGAGTATLRLGGHVTAGGGGLIALGDSTRAVVDSPWGYWLINATGHTIRGAGRISTPMVNHGLVEADQAGAWLLLSTAPKSNDGMLRATAGGRLRLEGFALTNAYGLVQADGATVLIKDATIGGGMLGCENGGAIELQGTAILSAVHNTGRLEAAAGAVAQLTGATMVNEGMVVVGERPGLTARIRMADHVIVSGGGEVLLADAARAAIESPWGYWLGNGADHVIRGAGVVSTPLNNLGVVRADLPGQALRLTIATKANQGLFEAAEGGILRCEIPPTNYVAGLRRLDGGRWRAGAGSALELWGCPIDSCAADIELDGDGSRLCRDAAGADALAELVRIARAGSLTIRGGRELTPADGFVNAGRIVIGQGSVLRTRPSGFTQEAGGTLRVEIGGAQPGQCGVLEAAGHAELAGRLEAVLVDGFWPALDDTFLVMTFASRSGAFCPSLPINLGAGLFLLSEWRPQSLVLRVVGPTGVDERPEARAPAQLRLAAVGARGGAPVLRLELPRDAQVEISLFDLAGRRLATLARSHHAAGWHDFVWTGRDAAGRHLASGVLLARARVAFADGATSTLAAKVVLVR